jgi:DNA-binding transcriptional MocR family regulator
VVVEDDYEFEMSYLAPASPSLKSLDREGRVIHAGSFSKSIFPGLRLGYLVGPAGFIAEARALRVAVLRHPPGHVQRTAAYFLSLGHYDALVNRMKQTFRRRRIVMDEAIRAQGLVVAATGGFGGSSFWMRAPEGVDTVPLAERLKARGVLIEPGRAFFDPAGGRTTSIGWPIPRSPRRGSPRGSGSLRARSAEGGVGWQAPGGFTPPDPPWDISEQKMEGCRPSGRRLDLSGRAGWP